MGYRNIPLEIKREYGEPLSEVIKGYALMGYSKRAVASALGIHEVTMGRWVERLGLSGRFVRSAYNDSCKPKTYGGSGRPAGCSMPRRYTDEQLLAFVADFPSYHALNRAPGVPAGFTIITRFGSWRQAKALVAQLTQERSI
jgi:hypothetical protein